MKTLSAYIFRQALHPLLAILASLVAIAILTQGLNQLDFFITNRNALGAFIQVTLLTLPQDIALVAPFATLFAVLMALQRLRGEGEIAVSYGAGMSPRAIASPILRLATMVALAHLAINAIVQPLAYRRMREITYSVQTDVASSLMREGSFTFPSPNLTLYARERDGGGVMRDVFIDDARGERPITYTARTGAIAVIDGEPSMVLRAGQVQRLKTGGAVELLDFDRFVLPLGLKTDEPPAFFLKSSDRTLGELFMPDLTLHYDQSNRKRFAAEAHTRLSGPLLDITLALIASAGALGGFASRGGYARRVLVTATIGMGVLVASFMLASAAVAAPKLNALQYVLPLGASLWAYMALGRKRPKRSLRRLAKLRLKQA